MVQRTLQVTHTTYQYIINKKCVLKAAKSAEKCVWPSGSGRSTTTTTTKAAAAVAATAAQLPPPPPLPSPTITLVLKSHCVFSFVLHGS